MKKYFFLNEEPNVNILGLDPIILTFHSDEIKKFTGRNLHDFIYEIDNYKMRAGAVFKEWMEYSEYLFRKIEKEPEFEKSIADNLERAANQIYVVCKEILERLRTEEINEAERIELLKKLFSLFTEMCIFGILAPIIEFGSGGMTNKLNEIFGKKTDDVKKKNEYVGLLSYRYEENYDQKGQKALAKIAQKIFLDDNLKNLFLKDNNTILKNLPDELRKDFEEHVFEWGWLCYGYRGPEFTINNVVNEIKGMLALDISPENQIKDLERDLEKNQEKQQAALKELNLDEKDLYMVKAAQNFTYTKYLRTKVMGLINLTINRLLEPFAEKEGLSLNQIGVCTTREILKYLETGELPSEGILNQRLDYCLLISRHNDEEVLVGDEARKWVKENVKIEEVKEEVSEISGQVACVGEPVKGRVKVVNLTEEMGKFEQGDILVAIATTPDIVPVMKKAAAIVTDIGGLTCHAAIVSRELGTPCVVGTKIATKVLKDGDLVEVDAAQGIIRKLK